uniref:Uncharacterized protein n=1 Tax=Rhizophora mucronata TaxID=61149 RepID=A0A2P2QDC2_RHIMU
MTFTQNYNYSISNEKLTTITTDGPNQFPRNFKSLLWQNCSLI